MKVSVAMCTYNGEQFIKEQLDSILSQTRLPDEIIIGDDNSKDNTVNIINKTLFGCGVDYNIIKNEKNFGVAKNFQNVILKCTGEIVFTADQDDVWLPEKVDDFLKIFETDPDCVLAFSDGYVTDKDLVTKDDLWKCAQFTKEKQEAFKRGEYYDILLSKNYITGAAMAFRRNFALEFIGKPIFTVHDYWIALHAPLYGKIVMINRPLIYYRLHESNVKGVGSSNFRSKIIRWIKNIEKCLDNSEERYVLSRDFYEENKILLQKKCLNNKILGWVKFNSWRNSLMSKNRASAGLNVIIHILKGEYREFYARKFSGLQDFAKCILKMEDK